MNASIYMNSNQIASSIIIFQYLIVTILFIAQVRLIHQLSISISFLNQSIDVQAIESNQIIINN